MKHHPETPRTNLAATVMAIGAIALTGYVLSRPGGPAAQVVKGLHDRWEVHRQWSALTSVSRVIRDGEGPVLIELADYQCPYCRIEEDTLAAFLSSHPTVQYRYVQFPLSIHRYARAASAAAICGWRMNRGQEMHHYLFVSKDWQSATFDWSSLASRLGMTSDSSFQSCIATYSWTAELSTSATLAKRLGIGGTPAFLSRHGGISTGVIDSQALASFVGVGG